MDLTDIDALVFSGGGVRGVAFCGALMALETCYHATTGSDAFPPPTLRYTAGASIGALFAVAVALGITGESLFRLLDTECILPAIAPRLDINRLRTQLGSDDGTQLRLAAQRVLELGLQRHGLPAERAPSLTLAELLDLTGVEVTVSVSRIGEAEATAAASPPRPEHLSPATHGDLRVLDALRMSMAIPLLFVPVAVDGGLYVDGALLDNVPVVGRDPARTLVLTLKSSTFRADDGLWTYLTTIMSASTEWSKRTRHDFPHHIEVSSGNIQGLSFHAEHHELVRGVLDGMLRTFRALYVPRG